jgi:hypothetical protein
MGFFSSVWSWVSGSGIAGSLARTALLVYASRLLGGNTDPGSTGTTPEPDKGVRLQLDPSTDNQIPVLYGEAYFGGNITDAQLSADYKKMTYCLTLAELTGDRLSQNTPPYVTGYAFVGVYLNNNRVVFKADGFTVDYTLDPSGNQDISYRDLIKIYCYIDAPLQPQGYSGTTPAAHTVMPGWTSGTHPMTDLCYAIVEVTYNKDKNVTGLPDCIFHMDTNMKKPGDVLVDYMLNDRYGAGISVYDLDSSFITLNTYADTGFTYTNLSSQSVTSAITINGLIDTTQPVLDNMKKLADAANAWISYDTVAGKWTVVINRAGSSIASFTDSNIIGDISISGTSLTQLNSAADVKYQNTDILDKTDFIKIEIPEVDQYANEPGKTIEISLPFTNSQVIAAKIGLVQLKQGRVDKIIKFKSDFSYLALKAGDLIDVTTSVYGFTSKVFRIITIAESFDDDGILSMDITALEYDAAVYTYNITEFDVETDGGILGIGSIGKPNTPTVTKTEQANVPRIVISGVVPSGVVDTLEYWITFDTGVSEASRNYIKIGQYSNPSGATLTEDATYTYTYTGLQQSDFYVKIRGTNSVTVGPYSDPSGLIAYVPIVVADTVSDEPVSIGGQLMGLGLLTLLNNLDSLFGGNTGAGGLFDKIFDLFNEKTGVDLVGSAQGGSLVVASNIITKDEGNTLTTQTASLNFVGDGVTVTGSGNNITVTINGTTDGGGGTGGTGGDTATTCFLTQGYLYPPDKSSNAESYPEDAYTANGGYYSADHAPITGYYGVKYGGGVYANLIKGSGNIYLYKSDGTLVDTKAASTLQIDKNLMKIPFADRTKGTDYYILMDGGVVKNAQGCLSPTISDPRVWNFNTPWDNPNAYDLTGTLETLPAGCSGLSFVSFGVRSKFSGSELTKASRQTDIRVNFGNTLTLGTTGKVKIYANSSLVQTIDANDTFTAQKVSELLWVSGNYLYIDPTVDFAVGASVYVTIESGVVKDACGNLNPAVTNTSTIAFTVDAGPGASVASLPSGGSIQQSPVAMTFDRPVVGGAGNVLIKNGAGTTVATVASNSPAVTYTQGVA